MMNSQDAELDIWNPQTEAEQQEFFRLSFSRYGEVGADLAERAKLIFEHPAAKWPKNKIVVEYVGKLRFYPAQAEVWRGLADAADCLACEILFGDRFLEQREGLWTQIKRRFFK